MRYLDKLLNNGLEPGLLDARIENGILEPKTAIAVLQDAGIINSPDYWERQINTRTVRYLDQLLINMANRCRIILEKIIHAEAAGEDTKGQILVGNVVLNRHLSKKFPTGIHPVVFQQTVNDNRIVYQFTPAGSGAYAAANPSTSVKTAVSSLLDGTDYSQGALFFTSLASANTPGNWHQNALSRLFAHGGHVFYK